MHGFVLLSGGIDSTTALYKALEDTGTPTKVQAFSIFYGQRHSKEIYQAQRICQIAGVRHATIKLDEQPQSMLTNEDADIPAVSYDDIEGVSPTYVWFRNGQMISRLAAIVHYLIQQHIAIDVGEFGQIYIGVHAEDAANWAYPDCTPEFVGAMANAVLVGTYNQVRLVAPLQYMMKHEIITMGEDMGVPWNETWSCYKGGEKHCGICPTCRARKDAFSKADVIDPTEYEG